MKKNRLKSSVLAGALSLFLFAPSFRTSGLKEITKPYLGTYDCTEARLSETEYLSSFEYIRLELKAKGEFTISYKKKGGRECKENGNYTYDAKRCVLTLMGGAGNILKREFPLSDGNLIVEVPLGEKNLFLKFEQK